MNADLKRKLEKERELYKAKGSRNAASYTNGDKSERDRSWMKELLEKDAQEYRKLGKKEIKKKKSAYNYIPDSTVQTDYKSIKPVINTKTTPKPNEKQEKSEFKVYQNLDKTLGNRGSVVDRYRRGYLNRYSETPETSNHKNKYAYNNGYLPKTLNDRYKDHMAEIERRDAHLKNEKYEDPYTDKSLEKYKSEITKQIAGLDTKNGDGTVLKTLDEETARNMYADPLNPDENKKTYKAMTQRPKDTIKDDSLMLYKGVAYAADIAKPFVNLGISAATNAVGAAETPFRFAQSIILPDSVTDRDFNTYETQNTLRSGISADVKNRIGLNEEDKNGFKGSFASFMSGVVADNTNSQVNAFLYGPAGGVMMGLNAAGQALYNAHEDPNASRGQALARGLTEGAAEYLCEQYSLGNWDKMRVNPAKTAKDVAKNLAKTMAVEGSEEGITEFVNFVTNAMIMGDKSEIDLNIQARMSNGESRREAIRHALMDTGKQIGLAAVGGALSGAMSTAGANAVGRIQASQDTYSAQDFRDTAAGVDTSTKEGQALYDIAIKYAEKLESGGKISNSDKLFFNNAVADTINRAVKDNNTFGPENEVKTEDNNTFVPENEVKAEDNNTFVPKNDSKEEKIKAYEQQVWNDFSKKYDKEGSEAFKENYDGDIKTDQYIKAFNYAYTAARYGLRIDKNKIAYTALLKKEQLEKIYKAGNDDLYNALRKATKTPYKERQEKLIGGVASAVPSADKNLVTVCEKLGKSTGIQFVISDSRHYDSKNVINGVDEIGGYKNGVVYIDTASDNPLGTISHEMTHWIQEYSPLGYAVYKEHAMKSLLRNRNIDVTKLIEQYRRAGYTDLTNDEIVDEIVSDAATEYLNDENFINEICKNDNSIADRVIKWLSECIDAIKTLMRHGNVRISAKALKEDLKAYEKTREQWLTAIEDAEIRMRKKEIESELKWQKIKKEYEESTNHELLDYISRIKNEGIEKAERFKIIKEKISSRLADDIKKITGVDVSGYRAIVRKQEIKHILNRHGENGEYDESMKNIKDIARIGYILDNYDEIREEKEDTKFRDLNNRPSKTIELKKAIEKDKHVTYIVAANKKRKNIIVKTYYRENYLNKKEDRYAADAIIDPTLNARSEHIESSNKTITYNNKNTRGDIENLQNAQKNDEDLNKSNKKNLEKAFGKMKHQLDLKDEVEQTEDLIAVHNLNATNLVNTLELGGFPSPSIAITKTNVGHGDYGDISVLFNKDTIDPKNSKNKVYGGDAWTPVFPKIGYKIDESKAKTLAGEMYEAKSEFKESEELTNRMDEFAYRIDKELAEEGPEDLLLNAKSNMAVKLLYLKDKGEFDKYMPEIKMKKKKPYNEEFYTKIKNMMGKDYEKVYELSYEELKKYEEKLKDIVLTTDTAESAIKYKLRGKRIEGYTKEKAREDAWKQIEKDGMIKTLEFAHRSLENTKAEDTTDYYKAEQKINEHLAADDFEGFKNWISAKIDPLIIKKGVRNQKDKYTKIGNRRKWEQIYDEFNLKNIVKAMNAERDKGAVAMFGANRFKAIAHKEFDTIDEIKSDSYRIQDMEKAEGGKQFEEAKEELKLLVDETVDPNADNPFTEANHVTDMYADVLELGKNIEGIEKELSWYKKNIPGRNYPNDAAARVYGIYSKIANSPVKYFEAKPKRAVELSEIATVVMPQGNIELEEMLKEKNINYVEYDPDLSGDRLEKINNIEGIKFQKKLKEQLDIDIEDGDIARNAEMTAAENKKLRRANAYLTNMLQANKDLTPSEKDIKKVAKSMKKKYFSTIKIKDLSEQIGNLYKYIRLAEHIDGNEVARVATNIAYNVIRKSTESRMTEDMEMFNDELRRVKFYINKKDIYDIQPEGFQVLQRRMMGKMWFTTKESSDAEEADTFVLESKSIGYRWACLSQFLDDEGNMPTQDCMNAIIAAREASDPKNHIKTLFPGATADEAAIDLSQEIIDAYFDVGNQDVKAEYNKTYKQFMHEIKNDIINEYNEKLREVQINDAKELQGLKKKYAAKEISSDAYLVTRDALNDYSRQQKEAADMRYKEKRDKFYDSRQREVYRRNIIKDARKLNSMLTDPTPRYHVPGPLAKDILGVLKHIDFSSNRVNHEGRPTQRSIQAAEFKASINALINTLSTEVAEDGTVTYEDGSTAYVAVDPDLALTLKQIGEVFEKNKELSENIDNMSTYNMQQVRDALASIRSIVENTNRLLENAKYENIEELAQQTRKDLSERKDDKRWLLGNNFKDMLEYGMLDTYTFMDGLGGSGHAIYDELRRALDKKIRNTKVAQDYILDIRKKYNLDDKTMNAWASEIKKHDLVGQELRCTDAQIMSLYLLNKRSQARMHMYAKTKNKQDCGIKFAAQKDKRGYTDENIRYKVNESSVEKLVNTLSEKQKAVADAIGRFFVTKTSDWGNEATIKLYGYKKFNAKNYFPIKVDKNTVKSTTDSFEKSMTFLKNIGCTKTVNRRAVNPIIIENIFDVYTRQVDDMSSYNAFVVATSDVQKWYNYSDGNNQSIKNEIKRVFGTGGNEYIINILKDMNGARDKADKYESFYKFAGRAKGAAVGNNLRVAIQQPTAYVRALAVMDSKYLIKGLKMKPTDHAKEWALCKKYAPIAQWKDWGYFDIAVGRSMKNIILGHASKLDKAVEYSGWLAGKGDEIAWVRLWQAAKEQVKAENKDLEYGTDEFYKKAGQVFSHVIDTTQVVDSIFHRTDMMKSRSAFVKTLTAFKGEPQKTYNVAFRAIRDIKLNNPGSKRKAIGVFAVLVLNIMLTNAAASIVNALRDHDKEKKFGEKWKDATLDNIVDDLNPLHYIPFVDEIANMFEREILGNGFSSTNMTYQGFASLIDALKKTGEFMRGDSKYDYAGWLYNISKLADLTGFGLKNGIKDIGGIIDTLIVGDDPKRIYATRKHIWDISKKSNLKEYTSEALRAYAQGDRETGDKIIGDMVKKGVDIEKIENRIYNSLSGEPEIEKMAEAFNADDDNAIAKLKGNLVEKGYSEEMINKKFESVIKNQSPYSLTDVADSLYNNNENAKDMYKELKTYYKKTGRTEKDLIKGIKNSATRTYKPIFKENPDMRNEIMRNLYRIVLNGEQIYEPEDFKRWLK